MKMIPAGAVKRKETPRRVRVASEVKKVLSEFLLRGAFADNGYRQSSDIASMIAITDVSMSPDLQHAKVFISSISPKISPEECLEFLEHYGYKLRTEVASSIRLRRAPELHFLIDNSSEEAEKIENLLKKIVQ